MNTLNPYLLTILILPISVVRGQENKQAHLRADLNTAIMAHRLDLAGKYSEQILKTASSPVDFLSAASVYELKGNYKNADELYQKALDLKSADRFKIYNDLGYVYLRRGDTLNAITSQMKSLDLNKNQPVIHNLLAIIYQGKNNPDSALVHGLQAYNLDPENADYNRFLVNSYYSQGQIKESIKYLEHLNEIKKNSYSVRVTLANFYQKVDRYDKALPLYLAAARDSVNHDEYLYAAAQCCYELNLIQDAIKFASQAIAVSANVKQEYYDFLITIYASIGQQPKVIKTYLRGKESKIRAYSEWLNEYENVLKETRRQLVSLPSLSKEQQRTSLWSLSKLYMFAKDYGNVIKLLNGYKELGGAASDSTELLYGSAYVCLRRYPEALKAISNVVQSGGTNSTELLLSILYKQRNYKGVIELIQNKKGSLSGVDKDVLDNLLFKSYTMLDNIDNAVKYLQKVN
jgi:Tfp pilus assembly protein PilF